MKSRICVYRIFEFTVTGPGDGATGRRRRARTRWRHMPDGDGAARDGATTATRAPRHRAIYLRETINSKLRLVRTLSDTRAY